MRTPNGPSSDPGPGARRGVGTRLIRLALPTVLLLMPGCKKLVIGYVADSLSKEGLVFRAEDDPELVREAIPFGLKTLESLLESSPKNEKLLLAVSSGFTQYAHAFVLADAEMTEDVKPMEAKEKKDRARRLFRRAWGYGFRGLEARHPGITELLRSDRIKALGMMGKADASMLYWTAAALASQISLSKDDMALVGRLPEVEALMGRALALDEGYGEGAIHEFYIAYESRSESMGGSIQRAHKHYERALVLTGGNAIAPHVAWAEHVAVAKQDRKHFLELLEKALAFNVDRQPRYRLANLIAQRRARWLKSRIADLFLED